MYRRGGVELLMASISVLPNPESTEGGRGVSVLKRRKGAPMHLG